MITCLPCAVGYHHECWYPDAVGLCHCCTANPDDESIGTTIEPREKKERGGQIKSAKDVKDLQSTGRKRAAKLYAIPKEGEPGYPLACEWQGLKAAGGGVEPIVGCFDGLATNIHHGPDKNTLSNFVGNVHRICATCHNRWHAANDQYYEGIRPKGEVPYVPNRDYSKHDGITKFTPEEFAQNELRWIRR